MAGKNFFSLVCSRQDWQGRQSLVVQQCRKCLELVWVGTREGSGGVGRGENNINIHYRKKIKGKKFICMCAHMCEVCVEARGKTVNTGSSFSGTIHYVF